MIKNIKEYKDIIHEKDCIHVFLLSSPIVVYISRLVIEEFSIAKENIIAVPFRNTSTNFISNNSIIPNYCIFDKIIKKFFLFSLAGYKLREKVESLSNKFILYSDWDNREAIELLNSKKCIGNAYIEEGQLSFHEFKAYAFKKNRVSQWKRLRRWNNNVKNMPREANIPYFNEIFNNNAFSFFRISNKAFPLINKEKKYILKDFSSIKKYYIPKILGKKNIGIMCSPRRFKYLQWETSIKNFINFLPENSAIKLHPAYFSNQDYLDKFMRIFDKNNSKKLTICDNSIIIEAEMLFEEKVLYGPITSLKTYAPLFGSKFIDIKIY